MFSSFLQDFFMQEKEVLAVHLVAHAAEEAAALVVVES